MSKIEKVWLGSVVEQIEAATKPQEIELVFFLLKPQMFNKKREKNKERKIKREIEKKKKNSRHI